MNYILFKNDVEINRIVSSPEFCEEYCTANGYTYEQEPESIPEASPRQYTDLELTQQNITDLELTTIEQGQNMTDLELMILEGYHV